MTPTELRQKQADQADRERMRIEDAAVRASRAALLAFTLQTQAALVGRSHEAPVQLVARLNTNLVPPLASHMFIASMSGRARSLDIAQRAADAMPAGAGVGGRFIHLPHTNPALQHVPSSARVPALARVSVGGGGRMGGGGGGGGGGTATLTAPASPDPSGTDSVNALAKRWNDKRLNLTEDQVAQIAAKYQVQAQNIVAEDVGGVALRATEKIAADLIAEPVPVEQAVQYIRTRLSAAGLTPSANHTIENLYRTSVQKAYAAGRAQADNHPAIREILWGYQFLTTADDRVCPICGPFDGMTLAKDDPAWLGRTPPMHFQCRCTREAVFEGEPGAKASDIPDGSALAGFGLDWGKLLEGV